MSGLRALGRAAPGAVPRGCAAACRSRAGACSLPRLRDTGLAPYVTASPAPHRPGHLRHRAGDNHRRPRISQPHGPHVSHDLRSVLKAQRRKVQEALPPRPRAGLQEREIVVLPGNPQLGRRQPRQRGAQVRCVGGGGGVAGHARAHTRVRVRLGVCDVVETWALQTMTGADAGGTLRAAGNKHRSGDSRTGQHQGLVRGVGWAAASRALRAGRPQPSDSSPNPPSTPHPAGDGTFSAYRLPDITDQSGWGCVNQRFCSTFKDM